MADFRNIPKDTEPDGYWHSSQLHRLIQEEPWKAYMPPFRIGPNIWSVSGNMDNGSFLIDTGDGLILADVPYFNTLYLQIESIRMAGYDPHDIKHIWITHPHGDHYGGARPLAEYTGAKIWMSRSGEEWWRERQRAGKVMALEKEFDFEIDEHFEDHNPFEMGNMKFRFTFHPGHCAGSVAVFFEDTDRETGKTYKIGMHGGIGVCSTERVLGAGCPLWHYYRYISDSLEMSEMDDIDITLPNHENQTNMHTGVNWENVYDYSEFVNRDVWKNLMIQKAQAAIDAG